MSSLLKYKTLRQLRIPVWPWRKLNPKHTAWMAKEVRRAKKKVTKPLVPRPPKTPTFYGMTLLRILKTVYGPSNTSTFVNLFSKAKKTSVPSLQAFLQLLEMRLDVILYRARFATSYLQLHQWIGPWKGMRQWSGRDHQGTIAFSRRCGLHPPTGSFQCGRVHAYLLGTRTPVPTHTDDILSPTEARPT